MAQNRGTQVRRELGLHGQVDRDRGQPVRSGSVDVDVPCAPRDAGRQCRMQSHHLSLWIQRIGTSKLSRDFKARVTHERFQIFNWHDDQEALR